MPYQTLFASLLLVSALFNVYNYDFTTLDKNIWSVGNHRLGSGNLNPQNVKIVANKLQLKAPAETFDGAEIYTTQKHSFGSYSARIKCPLAPGSFTAFFLYSGPEGKNHEIDIEIYNDSSRRIDFSTWVNGIKTHVDDWDGEIRLPFDPTLDFHEYRIDYFPEAVSFYVDGKLLRSWTNDIPTQSLHVMLNIWWPEWLTQKKPAKDSYVEVDKISFIELLKTK